MIPASAFEKWPKCVRMSSLETISPGSELSETSLIDEFAPEASGGERSARSEIGKSVGTFTSTGSVSDDACCGRSCTSGTMFVVNVAAVLTSCKVRARSENKLVENSEPYTLVITGIHSIGSEVAMELNTEHHTARNANGMSTPPFLDPNG